MAEIVRYNDAPELWRQALQAGLKEDGQPLDWTAASAAQAEGARHQLSARVVAKSEGVWASAGLLRATEAVAHDWGWAGLTLSSKLSNGDRFRKGATLVEWRGPAQGIHALERPFLNLAAYTSGIATHTRALVEKVEKTWKKSRCEGPAPRVTATRKTLPGYRDLSLQAVLAGGGRSHRVSLAGGVLIKENHVASCGGIAEAIAACRATAPHGLLIECEVRDMDELAEALAAKADAVLLDNFSPKQARKAASWVGASAPGTVVEVSGGITEASIGDYAVEGVHVISVGGLTHTVKPADLSLLVSAR